MHKHLIIFCSTLFVLTGCNRNTQSPDEREENDPGVAAAQSYMDEGRWDDAIAAFKKVLDEEPRMARPHLDLATIYQNRKNYIYAIYHYDRYLELRPDSEKADFIREQKLEVAKDMANALINNSREVRQLVQERNTLVQQNNDLKRRLAALKTTPTDSPAPAAAPAPANPAPATQPPAAASGSGPAQPSHQIYYVVAGDNLTRIAQKFYGNGNWEPIFEANRDTLRSPGDLKVGQTLVIPAAK